MRDYKNRWWRHNPIEILLCGGQIIEMLAHTEYVESWFVKQYHRHEWRIDCQRYQICILLVAAHTINFRFAQNEIHFKSHMQC